MIVPQYWAEGRLQHRKAGKQVTMRRFGWSDTSQAEAQSNADARTQAALARLLSGEKLNRREPKIPYNGADGVPIREEILDRRGDTIITRNSYGASCLNTPNVFFADVDFKQSSSTFWAVASFLLLAAAAIKLGLTIDGPAGAILAGVLCVSAAFAGDFVGKFIHRRTPEENAQLAIDRIRKFISGNTHWNLRIYRTPAGLRVLATHQPLAPDDSTVAACFKTLGTDPTYSLMCLKQKCFRARVSPKPWRIGIGDHMRPRPGSWPVHPDRLPLRNAWITRYQSAAAGFASCRLMESIGSGTIHPDVLPVIEWHDELSRATTNLPIA